MFQYWYNKARFCDEYHFRLTLDRYGCRSLFPWGVGATKLSIIDSVTKLLAATDVGNIFLGILILLFSIVFPIIKYSLLLMAFIRTRENNLTKKILEYGYWSMLDVFVVAVLVVSFKGFPGGSRITPMLGVYFFAASVVLSNFTHKILEKCLIQKEI